MRRLEFKDDTHKLRLYRKEQQGWVFIALFPYNKKEEAFQCAKLLAMESGKEIRIIECRREIYFQRTTHYNGWTDSYENRITVEEYPQYFEGFSLHRSRF